MNPEQIRARIRELLNQRATHEQAITDTRTAIGTADPSGEQVTALRAARDAIVGVDAELDQQQTALREALDEQTRNANAAHLRAELGSGQGGARVTAEERTYTREKDLRGERSFFTDAFNAALRGDMGAMQRLQRHSQEATVDGEMQTRAVSTGSFGGLVVPQYLVNLAARIMRSGRPTANAVARLPLPDQGMSLIIPRQTTGAAVASQATENSALQNTDEVWTNLTVPVATIGGQQDVSRQMLERGTPGVDEIIYMDLAAAYHAELDRQLLNGSGASGQMLGILNTAGISTATAFGGVITAASFNTKIAGQIAAIAGAGVGVSPKMIVVHPRRWGWLTSLSDTAGRPLVVPNAGQGQNIVAANADPGGFSAGENPEDFRTVSVVGSMQGLPIITDGSVPTNIGTNVEDVALVLDTDQSFLWEDGDGMPRQLRFEQTLGQNLTTKIVAYGYAAFTAGRYAQAVGRVGGADTTATYGMVAPTF